MIRVQNMIHGRQFVTKVIGKMYGLLLANMQEFVETKYGEKAWKEIMEALKLSV